MKKVENMISDKLLYVGQLVVYHNILVLVYTKLENKLT